MTVRIKDPYAGPGVFRKAQLHCHTTGSDGALSPADVAARYRAEGYAFVVFTDHNRVTSHADLNDDTFLALPGIEATVPRPFRPMGPHLGRLGAPGDLGARRAQAAIDATVAAGGVVSLHHPGWTGNLWSGRWSLDEMVTLRDYHLVEISNHHSASDAEVRRWATVLARRGPAGNVSGVAVDDLHRSRDLNTGWVLVKTSAVNAHAFLDALRRGAVIASTGPAAEFTVRGAVIACATDASGIRFLDAAGQLRREACGPEAEYEPDGGEGFVRVECVSRRGPTAWSQAFWLENAEAAPPAREPL
jgi:hypothetical protein